MTVASIHDNIDYVEIDIEAALEQLRLQLQNLQRHNSAIIISVLDSFTKCELTQNIVIKFNNNNIQPSSSTLIALQNFNQTESLENIKPIPTTESKIVDPLLVLSEATKTESLLETSDKDDESTDPESESEFETKINSTTPKVQDPLTSLYALSKHKCDLFFGVDVMLSDIETIPDSVNTGNGELRLASMAKVFDFMTHKAPEELQLTSHSSFLDIGSGFGRCVLHAVVQAKVKSSVGIEFVPMRCKLAQSMLDVLKSQSASGFAGSLEWASDCDWNGVQFIQGDAINEQNKTIIQSATHVYLFDKLFLDETKQQLLSWLSESESLQILACYNKPSQMQDFLDTERFHLVDRISSLQSTGNEQFTCYFYRKSLMEIKSNELISPRRSTRDRGVASVILSSKRSRDNNSQSSNRDPEWSPPASKRVGALTRREALSNPTRSAETLASELANKLHLTAERLAAEQPANQIVSLDLKSMQSAAEATITAVNSLYRDDEQSIINANQTLVRLMSEADGFKMVGYYFRSLLAQALYDECKRKKLRNYNKQATQLLGIVSHADRVALPQFAACIQRHAGGRDRCTVEYLLTMPLIRVEIPWHEWRDRLLVEKGKIVDEAMNIVMSTTV